MKFALSELTEKSHWLLIAIAVFGIASIAFSGYRWGSGENHVLRLVDHGDLAKLNYGAIMLNAFLSGLFYWVGFYLLSVAFFGLFGRSATIGMWASIGSVFEVGQIFVVFFIRAFVENRVMPPLGFFGILLLLLLALASVPFLANKAFEYLS